MVVENYMFFSAMKRTKCFTEARRAVELFASEMCGTTKQEAVMISTSLTCYLNLQYSHHQICWKSLYFGVNFETELVGTDC